MTKTTITYNGYGLVLDNLRVSNDLQPYVDLILHNPDLWSYEASGRWRDKLIEVEQIYTGKYWQTIMFIPQVTPVSTSKRPVKTLTEVEAQGLLTSAFLDMFDKIDQSLAHTKVKLPNSEERTELRKQLLPDICKHAHFAVWHDNIEM